MDFAARLRAPGVAFHVGPFILRVGSPLRLVADAVRLLYHDFSLASPDDFADFHVQIEGARGLRRWFRRQSVFVFGGALPYEPFPRRLALPLLEWGLNGCISGTAHQFLLIHSAVVEKDGRALLLPAPSGSGKSTLCAALTFRGWRLLSDEMALVRPGDGLVVPLPRPIGLKGESIRVIAEFAPGAVFGPAYHDTRKGTLAYVRPPRNSVARAHEPARPACIVFPRYRPGGATRIEPVPRARAFLRAVDGALNYSVLGTTGYETLAGLIDACPCSDLTFSDLGEAVVLLEEALAPAQVGAGSVGD
jgi:HprK-related kinase A